MALARLVALARAGDEEARSELLEQATRLVYGRVLQQMKGLSAAEDVAQDVLLEAIRALPRLRRPEAFLPWLRRITDNALADHWRARGRGRSEDSGALEQAPAPGDTPDRALERVEDRERVRAALAVLRPKSRLAIELFYFHELTSREVAYFLGVSDDAARASLVRARRELRREVSSMTTTEPRPTEIRYSATSSPGARRGPVFEHDSSTARLYLGLYPAGNAAEAAAAAGLPEEVAERELELLESMHLVVRQDDAWRCTMPVADETDMELMRLWAEPIAQVVIGHLESLYTEAVGLSRHVEGDLARSTVVTVAMAEAARRPFSVLQAQLGSAAPDRGSYGKFSAAVSTCEMPDARVLRGGHTSGHSERDGWEMYTYYLQPAGTNRPQVEAFCEAFDLSRAQDAEAREQQETMLHRALTGGITAELCAELADAQQIPPSRRAEFWRRLVDLQAIAERGDRAEIIVPVLPVQAWKEYLDRLDSIGEEIACQVTDAADGLRRRAARCSFADCYFADSVLIFFACATAIVGGAIDERGWICPPEEADLSWGVLIAA